jgi:Mrp family chromosome partitioning ATPase
VVIDAPPLLAVAETVDLAAMADGVILVVRPGTPLAELQAARDQLDLSGAHLLGYVYNRASWEASGFGYGGLAYGRAGTDESPNGSAAARSEIRPDTAPDAVP